MGHEPAVSLQEASPHLHVLSHLGAGPGQWGHSGHGSLQLPAPHTHRPWLPVPLADMEFSIDTVGGDFRGSDPHRLGFCNVRGCHTRIWLK